MVQVGAVLGGALDGRPVGVVLPVVLLAGGGVWAGAGARVLLRRLRRGTRIPPPWCELGVAVLWAATAAVWAAGAMAGEWVPAVLGLGWLAVAAGAVDLRHHRLPDAFTVPALPAALLLLAPAGPGAVGRGVVGAGVAVVVHAAVHLADRRAVGAGDVKLAAPLGAVLAAVAWPALALAAVLAALLTAAVAIGTAAGTAVCTAVRVVAGGAVGGAAGAVHGARGASRSGSLDAGCRGAAARDGPRHGWGRAGRAVPHGPSMLLATWVVTVAALALGADGGAPPG